MSPSLQIKLNQIGQRLVDRLVNDIKNKPVTKYGAVNASGKLAKSIRYEVYENGIRIKGEDYSYYLERGRNKNKNQSPEALKKWVGWAGSTFIADWIRVRMLPHNPYAVAWKIAKKGNTIFEQGGSDLVSGLLDSEFFADITQELEEEIIFEIKADIFRALAA